MPSGSPGLPDGARPDPATAAGGRLAWLRSQGLGLCCGFATVVLLAVGSVVLAATRDGASAAVGQDDLRGFFAPPSPVHLWLYLLLPVAGLYAVNTALATWDAVTRRWRAGVRSPAAYAAAVFHVGFLLALVAHAAGGFLGAERGEVLLGAAWERLPGFGEARVTSVDVDRLPDGTPRAARIGVEVRGPDGAVRAETVGWNRPLSAGAGSRLALLSDLGVTWVARLASGDERCALAQGMECAIAGERVRLVGFTRATGPAGAAAVVRAPDPLGRDEARVLGADGELVTRGGRTIQLTAIGPEKVVGLRVREAPGTPWALAAALVTALAAALLWPRLARRPA